MDLPHTCDQLDGPKVVWEHVTCPLCAAQDEAEVIQVRPDGDPNTYRLVQCRGCGLGYMNPRPDEASIGQFYPDGYEWYQIPEPQYRWWTRGQEKLKRLVMSHVHGVPPALNRWQDKLLAALASPWLRPSRDSMTALPWQGEGRLLEYGCGHGWYGQRMRQLGWQVTGMDLSPIAAAQVTRHFGFPVLVGTLPHAEVAPESFDVITMGAVLEHVHWPQRVLRAAAEALRPGGYLVVSVPNLASWGFGYFKEDWWGLQIPHHLLHFTPATLKRMLEMQGLEVRQLRIMGRHGWMRRSMATARRGVHRDRLLVKMGKLRPLCNWITNWTVWQNQGDCLLAIAYRPERAAGAGTRHAA